MSSRLIVLSALLLTMCACAGSPFGKAGASKAEVDADYQDCYSEAVRQHFTPEIQADTDKATSVCMKERGYHWAPTFNPW